MLGSVSSWLSAMVCDVKDGGGEERTVTGHLWEGLRAKYLTPFPHSLGAGDLDPGRTPGENDPRPTLCECPGCSRTCAGETGEAGARRCWAQGGRTG